VAARAEPVAAPLAAPVGGHRAHRRTSDKRPMLRKRRSRKDAVGEINKFITTEHTTNRENTKLREYITNSLKTDPEPPQVGDRGSGRRDGPLGRNGFRCIF